MDDGGTFDVTAMWEQIYNKDTRNISKLSIHEDFKTIIRQYNKAVLENSLVKIEAWSAIWNLVEQYCIDVDWLDLIPTDVLD